MPERERKEVADYYPPTGVIIAHSEWLAVAVRS